MSFQFNFSHDGWVFFFIELIQQIDFLLNIAFKKNEAKKSTSNK